MKEFNKDKVNLFLGAVRKYMQVRGALSQKDLSNATGVGVSTMSRFLTQKTTDLNPQLISRICAVLEIPLHEIIDFVDPSFTEQFIRLVKFYKEEVDSKEGSDSTNKASTQIFDEVVEDSNEYGRRHDDFDSSISQSLGTGSAKKNVNANIKVGGKPNRIPFSADNSNTNSELSIKEKLEALTPRQKAYMSDFLNLDMEGKDLIVDLGNNLFRYFKQKGMDF